MKGWDALRKGAGDTRSETQALLLIGRHRLSVYIYIHKRWEGSLCLCLFDLTQIESPTLMRVNDDVTLGLGKTSKYPTKDNKN